MSFGRQFSFALIMLRAMFLILLGLPLAALISAAAEPKSTAKSEKPVAEPAPLKALLKVEDWQQTPIAAVTSDEIDRLLADELKSLASSDAKAAQVPPAARTTDEEFIRRVTIDVCGRLPTPEETSQFVADASSTKREILIDKLLESGDYAAHWARYWSDVVSVRVSPIMRRNAPIFEEWLYQQFRANRPWGEIVKDIIAADAVLSDTAKWPNKNATFADRAPAVERDGATFFIATHYYEKTRTEGAIDLAAETSRVFLGIQLQCAQCHDHPSDQWKRVQFHQLAAYFARSGGRPRSMGKGSVNNFTQVYYNEGEYEMPDQHDPLKMFVTHPAFLDGKGPAVEIDDKERRAALAEQLIDKRNYWFAAAFVNRMWGELMGQTFYEPVDDLGPQKSALFRSVLTRLTGAFRASDYDIKDLLRTVLNTEAYQQQFRLGESADEHLNFTASVPSRMQPGVLWQTINNLFAVPPAPPKATEGANESAKDDKVPLASAKPTGDSAGPTRKFAQPQGPEADFLAEFDFDLSLKPQPSLTQALLMMNSYTVNGRIPAQNNNLLGRLLREQADDGAALQALYLKVLARRPTDHEMTVCRNHIEKTGKRSSAFEDILWSLVNSAEFQLKR